MSSQSGAIILLYHDVGYSDDLYSVTPEALREQLRLIRENTDGVITYEDLRSKNYDDNKRNVILSFDDGRKGQLTYASDILFAWDVSPMLFLCPGFQDSASLGNRANEYLTWDEVLQIVKINGAQIGAHTYSHPHMTRITSQEAESEIAEADDAIRLRLGVSCRDFAYPYGEYHSSLREKLAERYETLSGVVPGYNKRADGLLDLRRTPVLRSHSAEDFLALLHAK